jgi:hypothetical protein
MPMADMLGLAGLRGGSGWRYSAHPQLLPGLQGMIDDGGDYHITYKLFYNDLQGRNQVLMQWSQGC